LFPGIPGTGNPAKSQKVLNLSGKSIDFPGVSREFPGFSVLLSLPVHGIFLPGNMEILKQATYKFHEADAKHDNCKLLFRFFSVFCVLTKYVYKKI
jgi:hypothetical protein